MPYKMRTYNCPDCGATITRRAANGAEVRCIQHATERSVANMTQMKKRSGPLWDKYVARVTAYPIRKIYADPVMQARYENGIANYRATITRVPC